MNTDISVDERERGLAVVTINRAEKHNALASSVLGRLAGALHDLGSRPAVKVILLRGAGDKFFAAGGDLVELSSVRTSGEIDTMGDAATRAIDAVRYCEVPVIAYLNGDAIGGGAELAVSCDARIMAMHARIGFIQGMLGITTAWGGGPDLIALVGSARATRMMSRCEMIDTRQALAWGLADMEVADGDDGKAMNEFLRPMLERTSAVLRGIKQQAIAWREGRSLDERRTIERRHLRDTWMSEEHWRAVDKFMSRSRS
jgi:enoyl-CoA hydratase